MSNSNALYYRLRHAFHPPPAHSICKSTRNMYPYILTYLPNAHMHTTHTNTHTHTNSGNRYLGKYILFIKWSLNVYFVQGSTLSALGKTSHRKAWQTRAHMHNYITGQEAYALSMPYTTQVRDVCSSVPIPT